MRDKYDIVIIGAGMAGVCVAVQLQKAGMATLLLDRAGVAKETSFGNAGIIESSYVLPFSSPPVSRIPALLFGALPAARINYPTGLKQLRWMFDFYRNSSVKKRLQNGRLLRPLVENAVNEHKELLKGTDALQYLSDFGRVKIHRTEASFLAAAFERRVARDYGVPFDVYDAIDFVSINSAVNPCFFKAVSWSDSARYLNPMKALAAVVQKYSKDGGIYRQEEVTSLCHKNGEWCIEADNQVYRSAKAVVCAGPWANQLLSPIGEKFPIGIKRGYHQHYSLAGELSHALVDADTGFLVCPMEGGARVVTGAEFSDLHAAHNPVQLKQVLPKVRELVNIEECSEDSPWCGSRPCTVDSLPIIGESIRHKGLWFNLGHGHSGITTGPSSAKLLSEMILGGDTFCDPAPYSPLRFA